MIAFNRVNVCDCESYHILKINCLLLNHLVSEANKIWCVGAPPIVDTKHLVLFVFLIRWLKTID